MGEPELNYDNFANSLRRLQERYMEYQEHKDGLEDFLIESLKESCIQRFETCFDTSWKHLGKYLEAEGVVLGSRTPKGVFKEAHNRKVIDDADLWLEFTDRRNDTTHDYDSSKANAAFEVIGDFIIEAIALYETMTGNTWQK